MRGVWMLAAAQRYLLRAQNPDGGYPQQRGGESNAQSTAWAIQGLLAALFLFAGAMMKSGGRSS